MMFTPSDALDLNVDSSYACFLQVQPGVVQQFAVLSGSQAREVWQKSNVPQSLLFARVG